MREVGLWRVLPKKIMAKCNRKVIFTCILIAILFMSFHSPTIFITAASQEMDGGTLLTQSVSGGLEQRDLEVDASADADNHNSTQLTTEEILFDVANTTGYVHPMIAKFYKYRTGSSPESNSAVEVQPRPELNSSSSDTKGVEFAQQFDLSEKNPPYERITYLSDFNGTNETPANSLKTILNNGQSNLYGTYYLWSDEVSTQSTEPENRNVPAPPQIVKEAHWFPKQYHARIQYKINVHGVNLQTIKIHVILEADRDTYSRYFRVYIDQTKIYENIVSYYNDPYNLTISATVYNSVYDEAHLLTFEIYSGSYTERGWMLTSLWLENAAIAGEYFPKLYRSKLEWKVLMGSLTQIDIYLRRVNDQYSRYLTVFVDGQQMYETTVGSYKELHLDDELGAYCNCEDNSAHVVTLQIRSGSYTEQGWLLELFRVHHEGFYYEVDYMEGREPRQEALDYTEEYYINHGYHRIEFVIDDELEYDSETSFKYDPYSGWLDCDYKNYVNNYYDHKDNNKWKYIVYGNYRAEDHSALGITSEKGGEFIFIARGSCDATAIVLGVSKVNVEKSTLMHEVGHSVSILDTDSNNNEIYCSNAQCVMAEPTIYNCVDNPVYCAHHWRQRRFS